MGPIITNYWPTQHGVTDNHKHRAFPSLLQLLPSATGSLEEKVLPVLQHWLSSRAKKVQVLMLSQAVTSRFFVFHVNWNFLWNWQELVADQNSTHCFIGLWVKIWARNKSTCLTQLNPVPSRSKFTTCLRKGCLLRFKSNSTATSNGCSKKLANNVWHDS